MRGSRNDAEAERTIEKEAGRERENKTGQDRAGQGRTGQDSSDKPQEATTSGKEIMTAREKEQRSARTDVQGRHRGSI